jgi:hypothetical protein
VKNVLFGIGSGGVNDFTNINNLLQTHEGKLTLVRNFSALTSALNIQGFDFDDEDYFTMPTAAAPGPVVELTRILAGNNDMIVTWCPYQTQDFWNACLSLVYQLDQANDPPLGQSVQWWNLQCYSGGFGNSPADWSSQLPTDAGVSDAVTFIVPGLATGLSPSQIQTAFAAYETNDPGLNGGFIWNSSGIFGSSYTPSQYAQAIITGLG